MYDFQKIEKKWQKIWERERPWAAENPPSPRLRRARKYYALVEFPYPSGEGLHVGHIRSYTALDIIARKRRMEGYNVLYPMGWDAFGLPTEQYAIKTGVSPEEATAKNIGIFKRQLKSLGFSFDWRREINTSDPDYYKWTQWIFLQFFKHGLAYKDTSYIYWCPACQIGLANEEAAGGRCERCGGPVEKKMRKQWLLRITAYADKLLKGLKSVDFLEEIKTQQINWIGRSEGREIKFKIYPKKRLPRPSGARNDIATSLRGAPTSGRGDEAISVFTTRPDTIDGATYLVLAPEHPVVASLLEIKNQKSLAYWQAGKIKNKEEIKKYIKKALNKTDLERQENKEKTGVELKGIKAINPYNNEKISIWVADYVMMHYGTGAIMAVPAHDERDRAFAEKYKLPIIDRPLLPRKKWPGKPKVYYKLRDWVFSRQRYWGEPIPIIICEKCGYAPVPEKDLPVKLPKIDNYQPRPDDKSPLAAVVKWLKVKCPACGDPARRETDVMPNWAGSSWYYLAYAIRENSKFEIRNSKLLQHWLPVDWYNGGMEHTTLHLLYSRFWNQFLYDIGVVPYPEPYQKRTAHGLILGEGGEKMSKSKGNVVNPDDLTKEFGADALRLYEMFIGPFRDAIAWNSQGIVGMQRFLNKIHNLVQKSISNFEFRISKQTRKPKSKIQNSELEKLLHQTVKKVSEDIEEMKFNTAVSSLMILVNKMEEASVKSVIPDLYLIILLKLLFPFAPHLAQELWERSGQASRLDTEEWPKWNPKLTAEEVFTLVIQINGKTRATLSVRKSITQKEAAALAAGLPAIKKQLLDKIVVKTVFVPDQLINFVVG